jgi:NCAIR mutase (PurE)-related protein
MARLVVALAREQGQGLASRLGPEHWAALESAAAETGLEVRRYQAAARALRRGFEPEPRPGRVAVLTAGTSDLAVAQEARMVVEACGLQARVEADLGVAGLHRLLGPLAELLAWRPDALVVAAGMDGVLPGVVAGLVDLPVIGVPVSTGYGAGGSGEAALLTMLQSCSTGLVTVNIDNGVGAGAAAVLIAARAGDRERPPSGRRPRPAPGSRGSAGPGRRQ